MIMSDFGHSYQIYFKIVLRRTNIMSKTTEFRISDPNNLCPQKFKNLVEERQPKFISYDGNEYAVSISLNENPEYHSNSSIDCFGATIKACASAISDQKFKIKEKAALVLTDEATGEVLVAIVSDYDKEGENYFFNITFNSEDIADAKLVENISTFRTTNGNFDFIALFNAEYMKAHNITVVDRNVAAVIIRAVFETIFIWLDQNAVDGEVIKLIITDRLEQYIAGQSAEEYKKSIVPVAICSVETVKDVKKMSIQFAEELKAIAKGNSDINS
jgi:hypothetical protein